VKGKKRIQVRKLLRALHRDIGYLAIGLTLVYAISGLAINHIADWDPNFTPIDELHSLPPQLIQKGNALKNSPSLKQEQTIVAQEILSTLGRANAPIDDVFALDDEHLDITSGNWTLYVDFKKGTVREEGQKARFLLRAANWLHLNRGKKAWTYIADGFAVFLLYLAGSGLFMLPGKKGLRGRGGLLVSLGVGVPIAYVVLSGGP